MYRKNVAGQNLPFVMIKASDGSAHTGQTVTARRSIDGGAQAAATGTVSELANGQYNLALSQADTNGNQIGILLTTTGGIPVHFSLVMTAADPTNAVNGGMSALPPNAAASTGGLACLVAFGGTATAGGASTVTLPSPASTVADFYKGLEVSIVGGTGVGQSRICTTSSTGRVLTLDRAWATNPDATSVIEVRDIAGPPLDTNLKVVGVVTADSVTALGSNAIGAGSFQTDSITSGAVSNGARDEIAGQVWEEARSGHTTAGSFGQGVASVQGNVTGSAASVTGAVGSVTGNVGGNVVGSVANVTAGVTVTTNNDKTGYSIGTNGIVAGSYQTDAITSGALSTGAAQEIAGQVWDVVLSGHLTAGTTGNALNAAGSAGDPWSTALPGAYGAGTAGKIVGDNINATILSRSSHTAADVWAAATRTLTAQSDTSGTTTLLSRLTAGRATNLDFLDVAITTRLATSGYTAPPSAATVAAAIIATTLAELPAASLVSATPSLGDAIMLPFMAIRNGIPTTATSRKIRNNAGTAIMKAVMSDDGTTFEPGALVAGP